MLWTTTAFSQVSVVVPFSAGGPTDRIARAYTEALNEEDPTTRYFVENVVGAGGAVASKKVVESKQPTLYVASAAIFISSAIPDQSGVYFDVLKEVEMVSSLGWIPIVLMSNQLNVNQINPSIFFGHAGVGSTAQLMTASLNQNFKFPFQTIAYKGSSDSILALLRNEIQYSFYFIKEAMVYDGQRGLKVIGIAGTQRNSKLPHVPTFQELGIKNFELAKGVHYLYANKATPSATLIRIHLAITKVKRSSARIAAFADNEGLVIEKTSNEKDVFNKDAEFWKRLTIQATK